MINLRFTAGPRAGQTVRLETALATLGRAPSCDIVVDDAMISAVHVTFEKVPAGYVVSDQQSSNGTLINGQRVFRALLRIGDELVVGSTGLKVERSDGLVATRQAEAWPEGQGPLPPRPASAVEPSILEVVGPLGRGVRATPIPPGGIVVGRHPACGLVLDDPQISGRHCKIVVGPEGAVISDVGSSNGTFVDDERLEPNLPRLLSPSSRVLIGGHSLRVRGARKAAIVPTEAAAAPPRFFVEGAGARVEVTAGGPLTIGRLPTSSLVLTDPQASGQHCELRVVGAALELADVGSRNGTFLVGARGETRVAPRSPVTLAAGDTFRIGAVRLRVGMTQPAAFRAGELTIDEPRVPKALRGARLTFVGGERAGTERGSLALERVATSIGRASDNDLVLDDISVSARHCSIVAEERGFVLREHGSSNGTFVNGERVEGERLLQAGDLIRVGLEAVMEFTLDGAARITLGEAQLVEAAGAMQGAARPRFVVRGAVLRQARCTIGRDVACDLFLDDPTIPRSAAEIAYADGGFVARSLSPGALLHNGRVIAEVELKTGDVLRLSSWSLRVELAGARCTLHEKQQHISLNSSWAREAELAAQAPVIAEAALPLSTPPSSARPIFSTLFAADAVQLQQLAPKREKRKGAPKWKATSDLAPDGTRRGAALIGAGAAAVVLAILFGGGGGARALLDGELARGHDSAAFARLAGEHQLGAGCRGCHTPMQAVPSERCAACHAGFAPKSSAHVAAGLRCASCHEEHRGAARGDALVARSSCAHSGCHDAARPPHRRLQPEAPTPFIASVRMLAPAAIRMPGGGAGEAQERLHQIHANTTRKCMSCHTAGDGASPGVAAVACFRCHDRAAVTALLGVPTRGDDNACLGCHSAHDKTLPRVVDVGPRWSGGVSAPRTGAAAALAVGALFLLVGGFASRLFARRVARVAEMALEEPAEKSGHSRVEAEPAREPADVDKGPAPVKLQVNVNLEKCVGCANCVNACPTAVLEIVRHKSTVVSASACTSCRECELVCPSGALTMAPEGAPPRLIDLPDLDPHYQTNVPGLYLIGEAAGKSLVKNSANLGRVVVEHMVAGGLQPGAGAEAGADVDIVCVGSGPGGLSAAIVAKRLGLTCAVLEKDRVYASTIQFCPKGKIFQAEPYDVKNISPLPIDDNITKEELIRRWDEVLRTEEIEIRLGEEVLDIRREQGLFVITTLRGIVTALRVVLAPGTRGSPRKLGVTGQELEKVSYMLVDAAEHRDQHLLVVGGGDSAVECAMALAEQPGNTVTISYRQSAFTRIKPRNHERLRAMLDAGRLRAVFDSVVQEVKLDDVDLVVGGQTVPLRNDFVYCLLGADLPTVWLQQLGVRYIQKPEGWNPGPTDAIVVGPPLAA
jgi:pSer/pThr/pTyr-binding forkhead associated (FHA) protein/thioredoxin reductase/ferredoxin